MEPLTPPPILCIPGMGLNATVFDPLMEAMGEEYLFVVVDGLQALCRYDCTVPKMASLAMDMLDGSPPIARGNYLAYLETCEREMTRYRKTVLQKGYRGLAACCDCYLDFYRGDAGCKRPWDREGVWRMRKSQDSAECSALGLDETLYISTALR